MQDRTVIEERLSAYPDLLPTGDIQEILGGMCVSTVWKIIRRGEMKSFKVGTSYLTPKECVIDYMLSEKYKAILAKRMASKHIAELKNDLAFHRSRLLDFCCTPRSKEEMMFFLNLKSENHFYRLFLNPLLETGELHRAIMSKTTISKQKYVRGIGVFRNKSSRPE